MDNGFSESDEMEQLKHSYLCIKQTGVGKAAIWDVEATRALARLLISSKVGSRDVAERSGHLERALAGHVLAGQSFCGLPPSLP